VDTYLLDTNHVIPLLRKDESPRKLLLLKLAALPSDSPVCIATVTLAELEVGCADRETGRTEAQAELRKVVAQSGFDIRPFTKHTAAEYGAIKAALMKQYNRESRKKNRAKWPEGWIKPETGDKLGADELDLMLVSHAVERNMVLVSTDHMNRITEALRNANITVRRENWLQT
jgi:predicted nucleic acid-binding protein